MNIINQTLVENFRHQSGIISVIAFHNTTRFRSHTDTFDLLLLIVSENTDQSKDIFHYIKDGFRIQERWLDPVSLETWLLNGDNRNIIYWLLQGEILLDRGTYLEGIRHRLLEFPELLKEQKLLIEFTLFLSHYVQTKEYLLEDHLLDAYSNVLESLHHWARIVIIEEGIHPELTVWSQVRKINPGVYKLYEELTLSNETVKQRVELVLLATEFTVMSKMKSCSSILLRIIGSRVEPWSIKEIQMDQQYSELDINLPLLLNMLVKKSLVREVAVSFNENLSDLELRYTC